MFGFWKWTKYEYRIVLFGPNYSNNSNSDRILIVSIENLDRILNTEYIRVLKMDRIRISNTTIRSSLFEYSNSSNNSWEHCYILTLQNIWSFPVMSYSSQGFNDAVELELCSSKDDFPPELKLKLHRLDLASRSQAPPIKFSIKSSSSTD